VSTTSVSGVPTGGRRPGRPRDQRVSRAITEAALRQLDELGYGNLSLESVASEAGVSRATIYRRYRDKADLVTAAVADNSTTHLQVRPSSDPRSDLVGYLTEFDERYSENCLEVVGSLIGARGDPWALSLHRERVVRPRMAYLRTLLVRAQELGQLSEDADVDLALQMLTGSVFARRLAGMTATPGWAERAVDAVWSGMGTPAPAPASTPSR
jgi:AcrR family transcriptional regulator